MKIRKRFFLIGQYLAPHYLISKIFGYFANSQNPIIRNWMISRFIRKYNVNLIEAKIEDPKNYKSFNAFFTRALKAKARIIDDDPNCVTCPADGIISQFGKIDCGYIFEAKGHKYNITELLGGNLERSKPFFGGDFFTIYIAPENYHRIHMPVSGILKEMVYIPGQLFSVNPFTAQYVPNLFARNKRIVCLFRTEFGLMAIILIGAMLVSSIETVWAGTVIPPRDIIHSTHYDISNSDSKIQLKKGEEMGRFQLGSTVIVLFEPNKIYWKKNYSISDPVYMGKTLAVLTDLTNF